MASERFTKAVLTVNPNSIRVLFERANEIAAKFGADNVYDFALGNPNFPPPDAFKEAVIDLLNNTPDPMRVLGYTSNVGDFDVRKAIAESINKRFQTNYTANNLILPGGAAAALCCTYAAILDPGDEVIAIAPFFGEYRSYTDNCHAKLVAVPADVYNGFMPDCKAIGEAVTQRTKAVIIDSPNNPTGVVYTRKVLEQLAAVLEIKSREIGHPIYLVSDEPYREIAYDGVEVPWVPDIYRNTIVCYSWSKSLSLAGERIGYALFPSEIDDYDMIYKCASRAVGALGYVSAPSLMQFAVARCLDATCDVSAYDNNRKLLCDALKEYGYDFVYPQGAFYLWLKCPIDPDEFSKKCLTHHLLLVSGATMDMPGYVRIAYCVSPSKIKRSLPSFKALAQDCGLIE